MYSSLYRNVFSQVDAETAHQYALQTLRVLGATRLSRRATTALVGTPEPSLAVQAFGLNFTSPLGVAAGFDKNAQAATPLALFGFSHVEVGTITAHPQAGNPRPRLFRLPHDQALLNRMGFNNDGAVAIAGRLAHQQRTLGSCPILGINIGKTKACPQDQTIADYVDSATRLGPFADYLVVNVSSPNTPGLRDLQAVRQLRPLLSAVREVLAEVTPGRRVPLLVKLAPDLANDDLDAVGDLALELGLQGIIATNTTLSRQNLTTPAATVEALGAGGISGAPLEQRSLEVLQRLYRRVGNDILLVGVGGIFTAEQAWQRICNGATLIQTYTGMVYGGPLWAKRINQQLATHLANSPYRTLAEATGSAVAQ